MEEIDQNIDPELEVKKLQDLVKKLEKQNEQLRNARRSGQSITDSPTKQRKMTATQQKNREQEINKKLANVSLDEVDLVKIMSDDDEDDDEKEDSWLYVSPARTATPTHKNTSPYKWVRQDFEKSSPEIDSTRQSLLLKLDECSRGYTSVYSPNVSRDSNDQIASLSPIEEAQPPSPTIPQIKQQLRDIRTITASKWSSASSPSRSGTLTPSTPLDEAFLRRKESDDADDEDEDSYKLQDMTDVQVMARIQEETLRKSQTSTPTTQTPPGRENSPRNKSSNSKENVPPQQWHGRENSMDKILKSARAILEFGHQVEMRGGSAPDVLESNFLANETFPILEELHAHKKDKFKPYAEGAKPIGMEQFKSKPIVSSKVADPKSSTEPKMGLTAAIAEEKSRLEKNAGTAYRGHDSTDKVSKQMIESNAKMEKEMTRMQEINKKETHDMVRKRLFEDFNMEWEDNEKAEEVERAQRRVKEQEDMSELTLEVARATEMVQNMLKTEGKYKEADGESYENREKIDENLQVDQKEKGLRLEEVIGQERRQDNETKEAEMQEDSAAYKVAEKVVRAFQDGDQEPDVSAVIPEDRNSAVKVPIHTQEAKLGHAQENGHDVIETPEQAPKARNRFFSGDHVPTSEELANLDDSVQAVPERFLTRSPREDNDKPLLQDNKSVSQDNDYVPEDTSKLPESYLKLKQLLAEGVEVDETDLSLMAGGDKSSDGDKKSKQDTQTSNSPQQKSISDKAMLARKSPASKAVDPQLKKTAIGASQQSLPSPRTQASTEQHQNAAKRVDSPEECAGSDDGSVGFSRDDRSYRSLPRMSRPRKGSGSTDKPLLTQNLLQKRFLESNGYDTSQQEETMKFQALPEHSHLAKWLSTQNTPKAKHLQGSLDRKGMKTARSHKPEDARSSKSDMYPMTAKRRSGLKPPRSFGLSLHYPMAHALKSNDPEGCRSPASDIVRRTPHERRTSESEGYKTPSSDNSGSLLHVDDVKLVARLQEESLRQELSPRRLSSPRQRPDTLPYDDGDPYPEDEYESPRNLYYSPRDSRSSSRSQSPQRHLGDSPRNQSPKVQRKQYYTNDDNRSGSSNLSGSNSSLHSTPVNGEGREKQPLRRSMPNLSKSTNPATNQQSSPVRNSQNQESKMRTPTSTGSPAARESGLRQPQLRQSGSGIPRGTGIPTRQSPQAKSGIPRPGQRRGIPVPKSGIPTPGSGIPRAGMRGMRGEENWREGCY
ncbi:serine/arginine repetitive matrix protein 2-like [Branchiostoma lanceolatum]|uniref:serine/arginine repetitive matrix protein 2-like n=1 Tax=Branchiostoma lanceolatum TaxID=7740 RepID=UPI0034515101